MLAVVLVADGGWLGVDWAAVGWKQALGWFFAIFPVWFISIAAMQRIVAARDETTAEKFSCRSAVGIRTLHRRQIAPL